MLRKPNSWVVHARPWNGDGRERGKRLRMEFQISDSSLKFQSVQPKGPPKEFVSPWCPKQWFTGPQGTAHTSDGKMNPLGFA